MNDLPVEVDSRGEAGRRSWPIWLLIHTILWFVLIAGLYALGPRLATIVNDFQLSGPLLTRLTLALSLGVVKFWFGLIGLLGGWLFVDAVILLVLSDAGDRRRYFLWNASQVALPLVVLVMSLIGASVVFWDLTRDLSG
jgi:type II secretory pathway component PulF